MVASTLQAYGYAAAFVLQVGVGSIVAMRVRNRAGRLLAALFLLNGVVSLFYFGRVFEGNSFGRPEGGPSLEFWFDAPTGPLLAALAWELRKAHPARRFGGSEGIILALAGLQFLLVTFPPPGWGTEEVNSFVVRVPTYVGYLGLFLVMPWFGSRAPTDWMPRPEWLAAAFLMRPPEISLRVVTALPPLWTNAPMRTPFTALESLTVVALGGAFLYAMVQVARLYVVEHRIRPGTEVIPLLFLGGAMLGVLQTIGTYGPRFNEAQDLVNTASLFFVRPLATVVAARPPVEGARVQRWLLAGVVGTFAAAGMSALLGGTTWSTFLASLPVGVAASALFVAFLPALRHARTPPRVRPTGLAAEETSTAGERRGIEPARLGTESAVLLELGERNAAAVAALPRAARERLASLPRRDRLLLCLLAADAFGEGEAFPRTYAGVHFYTHIPYNDLGTVVDRLNARGAAVLREMGLASSSHVPVRLVEKRRGARKYYLLTAHGRQVAEAVCRSIPGLPSDPRAWINLLGEAHYGREA